MKFLSICALSVALMFSTLSCTNNHLISDEAERALVQSDFDKRAAEWNQGDLFVHESVENINATLNAQMDKNFIFVYDF